MSRSEEILAKIPKYKELLLPCIQALKALGGSGSNEEILDKVCEIENIPEEVQRVQHTRHGWTALGYRLAWARSYLKKVGAVANNERGIWTLTEKGSNIAEAEVKKIPAIVSKMEYEKRKGRKDTAATSEADESEEEVEGAEDWSDKLLSALMKMKADAFERLAQRILREAGFTKVEVTGKSGDGGIDGVGILRVNLVSFTVLFQCKRYQGSVGSPAIRDFRGAMQGRCDKGLVITTGTFSPDARREATRDGAPAIDLIDGEALCELLKSLKLGVSIKLVEEVAVDDAWFLLI